MEDSSLLQGDQRLADVYRQIHPERATTLAVDMFNFFRNTLDAAREAVQNPDNRKTIAEFSGAAAVGLGSGIALRALIPSHRSR